MTGSDDCPFCNVPEAERVAGNGLCFARWDKYPVSPGHMLIIPFRHFPDYFDADADEVSAIWKLVAAARTIIREHHDPDGFNIGLNVGAAAGQSVWHMHVHVIPRYSGDTPDPFGGVRSVVLGKGRYGETD